MASTEQRKIEIIADGKRVDASFKEMNASLKILNNQLQKLPKGSDEFTKKKAEYTDMKNRVSAMKDEMYGTQQSLDGLKQKFIDVIPFGNQIQNWVKNFQSLKTALLANITPLNLLKGAIISTGIGALLVVVGSLIAYLTSTQEGIDKVNRVMEPMRAIVQRLIGVLQILGGEIFKGLAEGVKNPRQAFQDFVDFIKNQFLNRINSIGVAFEGVNKILSGDITGGLKSLGDAMIQATTGVTDGTDKIKKGFEEVSEFIGDAVDEGARLAEMNIDIEKTENALIVTRAKLNVEYNKQKEIAQDLSKSEEERIIAARKARDAQDQLLNAEQNLLDKKIERKELENSLNDTSREDEAELLQLVAERTEFEATAAKKRASARSLENTAMKTAQAERDKLRQEEQKKEEEHQKEMQRLIDQYNQAKLDAQKAFEDLQIELMEEGEAKRIEKLNLDFEREMEALEAKKQLVLENVAITEEERDALLLQYEEERKLREELKAEEEEEIRLEEREARIERDLQELDEEEAIKAELLEQQGITAINREAEMLQLKLDMQKQFMLDKLKILEAEGKGETLQAEKLKTGILKIEKEKADLAIAEAQREEEFKRMLRESGFDSAKGILAGTLELMGEEAKGRKEVAAVMKGVQIAQTTIATYESATKAYNSMAGIPIVGPALGIAAAAAAVFTGLANVKKIATTKYASGGATGSGNTIDMYYDAFTGGFKQPDGNNAKWYGSFAGGGHIGNASFGLIGERGAEWVSPNWMLKSPKYANIFGYLEAERVRGRAYEAGGTTAPAAIPSAPSSVAIQDSQQQQQMMQSFTEMKMILMSIDQHITEWPEILKVVNDPREVADALEVLNQIEADSRITR